MLKLKLRSFRRFLETDTIGFQPGLTVVGGPNGAGKSTIVEAIGYALYGPPRRGYTQDVRSDNSSEETCVECELHVDGQAVKICRYSDRADVYVNGVLQVQGIPSSLRAANEQIRVLLGGLTREQFESTYVALQGDTAGLVADKPEKRREIIESILQLDILKKAVELEVGIRNTAFQNVKNQGATLCDELGLDADGRAPLQQFEDARKVERRIQHAQRFRATTAQEVENRKKTFEDALVLAKETEVKVQKLEEEHGSLLGALEAKIADVAAHEKLMKQHQAFDVRIATQEGQLTEITRQIEDLEGLITKAGSYDAAAKEHQLVVDELSRINARLGLIPVIRARHVALTRSKSAINRLDERLAELANVDALLVSAREKVDEAQRKVDELETDPTASGFQAWNVNVGRLEQEEQDIRTALATLHEHPDDAECPTCGEKLQVHSLKRRLEHLTRWLEEEHPSRTAALSAEKTSLDKRRSDWLKEQRAARTAHEEAATALANLNTKVSRRDGLVHDREEADGTLAQAQAEWDELNEKSPYNPEEETALKLRLGELRPLEEGLSVQAKLYADISRLRSEQDTKRLKLSDYETRLSNIRTEQASIGYDKVAHEQASSDLTDARTRVLELHGELSDEQKVLGERNFAAKQAELNLERAERYQKLFGDALNNFLREDRLQVLLTAFQEHFFTANTAKVAQRASRLLMLAVTDQSLLGIEFEGDELFYLDASHARKPIARLSGGEKALVGLCLRIALAEQAQALTPVGKLRLLVLDEVLSSLDDERRDAVQRILEDVQGRGIFESIILITHLDTVKQSWRASNLEVRKRDGKTSELLPVSAEATYREDAEKLEV